MKHVFVETNFLIDLLRPFPSQDAEKLFARRVRPLKFSAPATTLKIRSPRIGDLDARPAHGSPEIGVFDIPEKMRSSKLAPFKPWNRRLCAGLAGMGVTRNHNHRKSPTQPIVPGARA